ncbi:hypothetical protein ACHAW5_003995 [Stephanodiscus triporus]|uniref:Calmodulin-lysine N-methyltransferase n=1 Tax=Stephanodiscus triporus TaxID=2934178 RepID=A0ABD3MPZ9_9STRA
MLSIVGNEEDGRMINDGGRRRRRRRAFEWPPSNCIEFGAGAALPSLALLREGARRVVITDRHGDDRTFDALRMSVVINGRSWRMSEEETRGRAIIMPHTWGMDVDELLIRNCDGGVEKDDDRSAASSSSGRRKADLLIASDCIYNPTYHDALLRSAAGAMDPDVDAMFVVGYSLHGNVPDLRIFGFLRRGDTRLRTYDRQRIHDRVSRRPAWHRERGRREGGGAREGPHLGMNGTVAFGKLFPKRRCKSLAITYSLYYLIILYHLTRYKEMLSLPLSS